MTNNEIVEIVYRTYGLKGLINNMVKFSNMDQSGQDLEQYIYEKLLLMDNKKLNDMFSKRKLRNFCAMIIKNQRNGGPIRKFTDKPTNTEYHKYFKIYADFNWDERSDYSEEEIFYDTKLDLRREFAINKLNEYYSLWSQTGLTKEQSKLAFGAKLIVLYIDKGVKLEELGKRFGLCRQTIYRITALLKKKIRDEYNDLNFN